MQRNNRVAVNLYHFVVPAAIRAGVPKGSLESFVTALATGDNKH